VFTLNKNHQFASWSRPKPITTGYCYDSIMELHESESVSMNGIVEAHVERPDRVRCVNQHLGAQGLLGRMVVVPSRCATQAEICAVHSLRLFNELKSTHGKKYICIYGCPFVYSNGIYESSSVIVCGKPVYYPSDSLSASSYIQFNAADGEWQILNNHDDKIRARIVCSGNIEECATMSSWLVLSLQATDAGATTSFIPCPEMRLRVELSKTGSSRNDTSIDCNTYVGPHSFQAAVIAVGCVLSVAHAVHTGIITNGVAVVRPPGHHAKTEASQGFCLFNNVAVAAKVATTCWGLERVAILDWDIHHGNGTEEIFYHDPNVLVINLHRYDNRLFYPSTGSADRVGAGEGKGFNINIGWQTGNEGGMSDSDYVAAMRVVVLPILEQFKPSLLFISAGFDAAQGDPLGKCRVTCAGYAQMTQLLSSACNGKVVVVIEGGYNLTAVANSSEAVVITPFFFPSIISIIILISN
jgi:acetoin utilization deacetylase AcuC-like enzyme